MLTRSASIAALRIVKCVFIFAGKPHDFSIPQHLFPSLREPRKPGFHPSENIPQNYRHPRSHLRVQLTLYCLSSSLGRVVWECWPHHRLSAVLRFQSISLSDICIQASIRQATPCHCSCCRLSSVPATISRRCCSGYGPLQTSVGRQYLRGAPFVVVYIHVCVNKQARTNPEPVLATGALMLCTISLLLVRLYAHSFTVTPPSVEISRGSKRFFPSADLMKKALR